MVSPSPRSTAWYRRVAVLILGAALALGTTGCGSGGDQGVDLGGNDGGGGDSDVSDVGAPLDSGEDASGLDVGHEDAGSGDAGGDAGTDASVPMLDPLDDMETDEDEPLELTVDLTSVAGLGAVVISVSSSDLDVLSADGISVSGTGVERTVMFTPVANASGTTTITVSAMVDGMTVEETFVLTVHPVDDAPTIGVVGNLEIDEDESSPPLAFTVTAIDPDDDEADFTLTATSADGDVIPDANLVLTGEGGEWTITVTPADEQSSASPITITIEVTDDDGLTASTAFDVTVTPVNDAPTLSMVPGDQSMLEDGSGEMLSVGVADLETDAESLSLTAVSSMPAVLGVSTSGEGGTRTITLDPQANRFGTVTITLTVSDGDLTSMATFDVTVDPVNDAPVLSTTATLPAEVNEDAGTITIPIDAIDVDIDGVFPPQVPAQALSFSSTRTNDHPGLVTDVSVGGGSVVVTIADDLSGEETITLTVTDDGVPPLDAQIVLPIRVLPGNDAPTITQVAAVSMPEDSGVMNVTFDVADADLPAQTITVSTSSTNPALFPGLAPSNPTGVGRTVTLPLLAPPNANGMSTITVTASDGAAMTTMTFTVTVTPLNDPPTIVLNSAETQTTNMNTTTGPISFTVTDIDSPPCSLTLSSTTTNPTLLPTRTFQPACTAVGNSATRTMTVTPGTGQSGSAFVTVRATDAGGFFSQFTITVIVMNPA